MRILNEFKLYFKEYFSEVISIFFICVVIQFAHEFTNRNLLVVLFGAINKDIMQYVKLCVLSTYLVSFVKMALKEKREHNLWSALLFKIITIILLVMTLISSYKILIGYELLWLNILIFYISISISQFVEYIIIKSSKISKEIEEIIKYVNLLSIIIFWIITLWLA